MKIKEFFDEQLSDVSPERRLIIQSGKFQLKLIEDELYYYLSIFERQSPHWVEIYVNQYKRNTELELPSIVVNFLENNLETN